MIKPTKMPTHGMSRGRDGEDLPIAMFFLTLSLVMALLWWWAGCGSPCLQVKATRCNGSVVELCGSNGKWLWVMDCAEVRTIQPGAPETWGCGETTTGPTCVPQP